ncbi:MAG: AAA family ATPase [Desulfobacteraceae bacterium]|jgi:general secretion pathway protein A|nr:AAA family ATPase [Desulfobacteraceae bacterium]
MTYLVHFNLKEKPFKLSPDPRFMWFSEAHKEAWASLHFGVLDRRGFILLIGDVGTGKTTVINKLIEGLDKSTLVARISDPGLERLDFFKFLAGQFGLETGFLTKGEFLIEMNLFLQRAYDNRHNVVVIVDEAQRLSDEMLEEIRLLSNIERPDEKLINIVLVGQNELDQKLAKDANRALRQRITTLYTIGPLARNEVEDFIRFRLKVAGTEEKIFTDKAVRAITAYSKGNPRLINVICDQALLTVFVQGKRRVDEAIVQQCMRDLTFALPRGGKKAQETGGRQDLAGRQDEPAPESRAGSPHQANHGTANQTSADRTLSPASMPRRRLLSAGTAVAILALLALGAAYVHWPHSLQRLMERTVPLQGLYQKYFSFPGEEDQTTAQEVPATAVAQQETLSATAAGKNHQAPSSFAPRKVEPVRVAVSDPAQETTPETRGHLVSSDATASSSGTAEAEEPLETEVVSPAPLPLPSAATVIQFPYNSNEVPEEAYRQLSHLVAVVKSRPEARLVITGYTDGTGNENYNRNLSKFRADVIKSYFIGQGIDSSQITSIGRGSENPIAANNNLQGRSENRRVEVQVVAAD